jgi:hypothetical protein
MGSELISQGKSQQDISLIVGIYLYSLTEALGFLSLSKSKMLDHGHAYLHSPLKSAAAGPTHERVLNTFISIQVDH